MESQFERSLDGGNSVIDLGSQFCEVDGWWWSESEDGTCRYVLGEKGADPLVCVGVNPSTAAPKDPDPTMRQVKMRAQQLGCDGYLMLNLYPLRSPNPDDLPKAKDAALFNDNIEIFETVLRALNEASPNSDIKIWAAWGTVIEKRSYLYEVAAAIEPLAKKYGAKWYAIGAPSKVGHPHHPLYLAKAAKPESFDLHEYLVGRCWK